MNTQMFTHTGEKIDLLNPKEEENKIYKEDIAFHLSNINRYNGALGKINVATHSINCYYLAKYHGNDEKVKRKCLTHDFKEAYIQDLTQPIKQTLKELMGLESVKSISGWDAEWSRTIRKRFDIFESDAGLDKAFKVKNIDMEIAYLEQNNILRGKMIDHYTEPEVSETMLLTLIDEVLIKRKNE